MASEKLEIDVVADTKKATAELKDLTKTVEKLDKAEPEIEVTADDKASKVLDSVAKKTKALDVGVDVTVQGKVDSVLADLDKVAAKAKETAAAADALGAALGPELAAEADTSALVAELERAGLSLDEIKANADQLAPKLKELADADVGGKLGASLGTTRGKLDELGKSADSSKSVLANMVGNSVQDVSALGGIAGSAGVALGQMGEYMADAAAGGDTLRQNISNFAKVAGPVAALAVGIGLVTGYMNELAAQAKASEARTKAFGEAMDGAADDTVGLAKALREQEDDLRHFVRTADNAAEQAGLIFDKMGSNLPLIGSWFSDQSIDVVDAMDAAGISIYEFAKAVEEGGTGGLEFVDMLVSAQEQGDITAEQAEVLADAVERYGAEQNKAAQATKLANVSQAEANALLAELVTKADPMSRFGDVWATLMGDMRDGAIDTEAAADAINVLARELGLTQDQVIQLGLDKLADDAGDAAKATDILAQAQQDAADATKAHTDALDAQLDAMLGAADSHIALTNALDDQVAAQNESRDAMVAELEAQQALDKAVKEHGATSKEAQEAAEALTDAKNGSARASKSERDAAVSAAQAAVRYGEDQATAAGKTVTATQRLDTLNASLLESARNATPAAKQAIIEYIAETNKISVEKATEIVANADTAAAAAELNEVSGTRHALIVAQATVDEAQKVLDAFAKRNRGMTIPLQFSRPGSVQEHGGTTPPGGGIAGEAGAEFIKLPGKRTTLIDRPQYVPPGTRVTSVVKTRQILRGRRARRYAGGTQVAAPMSTAAGGPMTFVFQQQAPIYGVGDLDRHLEQWSRGLARQINAGRRS